MFGHLNK